MNQRVEENYDFTRKKGQNSRKKKKCENFLAISRVQAHRSTQNDGFFFSKIECSRACAPKFCNDIFLNSC